MISFKPMNNLPFQKLCLGRERGVLGLWWEVGDRELWAFYFFNNYAFIPPPLPSVGSAQGSRGQPGGRAGNQNRHFSSASGVLRPKGETEAPTRAVQGLGLSLAELGFEP